MRANISSEQVNLPLLPLRDVVVFPHMVIPLFVGRPKSIKALETSMESGKSILLVAQKTAAQDDPTPEDLYDTGSVATVLQMLKLPDGTVKVLVEGNQRARVIQVTDVGTYLSAQAEIVPAEGEERVDVLDRPQHFHGVRTIDPGHRLNRFIEVPGTHSFASNSLRPGNPLKTKDRDLAMEGPALPQFLAQNGWICAIRLSDCFFVSILKTAASRAAPCGFVAGARNATAEYPVTPVWRPL